MNGIRFANQNDKLEVKNIWKACFGDSDSFIDYYFQEEFKADRVLLLKQEEIASMLTMIPVELSIPNNGKYNGSMLYAVATHPKYQGKGLSTKLMDYAKSYLQEQGVDIITLVPATLSLTNFYAKQGYLTGFYHREFTFTPSDLPKYSIPADTSITLSSTSPLEYHRVRERLLSDYIYQSYQVDEIAYQKRLSLFFLCDIYLVSNHKDIIGCVILEKLDENQIYIKELLVPESYMMSALKSICYAFPSKLYTLRLPAHMDIDICGTVKPFGMYQLLRSGIPMDPKERPGYLGIAYD